MKNGCFGAILIAVIAYVVSWAATCGLIAIVFACFGWEFSWPIATGIWIVICILRSIFSPHHKQ